MKIRGINRKATAAAAKLTAAGVPTKGNEGFREIARKIAMHTGEQLPPKRQTKQFIAAFAGDFRAPTQKLVKQPQRNDVAGDSFLASYEWRRVRMLVLKRDSAKCACCGATPADGVRMNVDHIKPRKLFPQLALDPSNLQVLCEICNHGKGNWDCTDWRPTPHLSALDLDARCRLAEMAKQ